MWPILVLLQEMRPEEGQSREDFAQAENGSWNLSHGILTRTVTLSAHVSSYEKMHFKIWSLFTTIESPEATPPIEMAWAGPASPSCSVTLGPACPRSSEDQAGPRGLPLTVNYQIHTLDQLHSWTVF